MNSRLLALILSVVLVITLGGFALYYNQAATTISSNKGTITTISSQKTVLQAQLTEANSKIADLQGRVNSGTTQLTTIATQIDAAQKQITGLQTQVTQAKTQTANVTNQLQQANTMITALQGQAATLQAQVDADKTQISALQTDVAAKQSELTAMTTARDTLQTQVTSLTSIVSLNVVQAVAGSPFAVSGDNTSGTLVTTFSASYAGYLSVSGTTGAGTKIRVTDTFSGFRTSTYDFGPTPPVFVIPVMPGTITVTFLGSTGASENATITLVYTY